ncbi:MAG: aldo/keto reductase [Hyphomicrobiales bacterium]|nr:aldo/keto reductase [Hyphomicrobiales bacterium]MCP5370193.1 aldo/keto reductase [Hyphomicrobiales bacterium]
MDYVNLGRTGLKVSRLCLGAMTYGSPAWRPWVLDEDASRPFIRQAVELGINFFDTANAYSLGASEEVLGRALADFARRDEVVIATKVRLPMGDGPNLRGLSRKHIMDQIDASLRRLGTDYVDLYQIHRWDYDTPIEETMAALHDVVKAGKARYVGASSMYAWQFAKAQTAARLNGWTPFVSMQNQYNLVYREEEREMLPLCADQGVGVIPWSPLARGFLARRQTTGPAAGADAGAETTRWATDDFAKVLGIGKEADRAVLAAVNRVAEARGAANAEVALAWLLAKPVVTAPIIGASKPGHLETAARALEVKLSDDEVAELEAPYLPQGVVGFA